MAKKTERYKSPPVGFSLSRTTADNGCGVHQDKRTKRNRTRSQQRLSWQREAGQ